MKKLLVILLAVSLMADIQAQVLYEISGNGLKKSSFLFGTHHAIPVSSLKEVDNVFKCFNDCEAVVGEIVVNESEMAKIIVKTATMENSITKYLTEEEQAIVDSALQAELNLKLMQVAHMRPAMIENIYQMTIYEKLFPRKEEDAQMDSFFQRAAIEMNKPVYGLETIDEQLHLLLQKQSIERQAEMLVDAIRTSGDIKEDMKKLNELYMKGDIEALYDWMVKSEGYSEADKFLYIDERNSEWVERLIKKIDKKSCFIAVGALHLPGRLGLVELLKKKGYRVKPVK